MIWPCLWAQWFPFPNTFSFFHLLCIAQAVSPELAVHLTGNIWDTVEMVVKSLLLNRFFFPNNSYKLYFCPFFLGQVNRINLSLLLRTERSMGITYKYSFAKSCQTQDTQVVMLTPDIYILFISLLKLLYLLTYINRPQVLGPISFKATDACLGSKVWFQW